MQDWKDLLGLRVIRRVAGLINQRWNLGVGFADNDGTLISTPETERYATRRPLCDLVKSCPAGRARCDCTARDMLAHSLKTGGAGATPFVCHAGLTEIYMRVQIEGADNGLILAGGMLSETDVESQRAAILERTADLDIPRHELESAIAATAMLSGEAFTYLKDLLELLVREILVYSEEVARRERRLDRLARELQERSSYGAIIGKSPPMRDLYRLLDKVSDTDSTVLITGENGTGKELVARAVHFHSARRERPFVAQNCSAFNDNLLDSELFGHTRGAFTGANANKKGLFEVADGGTFFLDEIGDMSPALQVKLLRVLQEGTFIPVGSTETRHVDVRLIAATHRDLRAMVDAGTFREDLFYRVNVINVPLPALRDRREDIPLLVEHFVEKHSRSARKPRLSAGCLARLMDYPWPGNVRELENEIERLLVLRGEDAEISEEFLSPRIRYEIYPEAGGGESPKSGLNLPEAIERLERTMILDHLKRARWNKSRAAETLGISRRNLIRKVQDYGLDRRARNR